MAARGASKGGERREGGVQWSDGGPEPEESGPASDLQSLLAELDDGGEVQITREEPTYAAGFCGTWPVHDLDALGLLERIQRELGGHVYRLQPLRRQPTGRKLFMRGSRRIRIAGAPLVDGRPWPGDGRPAVIDTTARVVDSVPRGQQQQGFAALLQPFTALAESLGRIEARLASPAALPAATAAPGGELDNTLATLRKYAEFRTLLRELADRDDEDDEDDEEPPPPKKKGLDLEELVTTLIERKMGDGEARAEPKREPARPRLIRNGEATEQPPPTAAAPMETPADAAQQVADKLASLSTEDAVGFLGEVFKRLPEHVAMKFAARAMAEGGGA